jgi:GNAT acetyltransferase-like protein
MHPPPQVINTERLVLRRPRLSDAAAKYSVARDPEVNRYMDWLPHKSVSDATAVVDIAASRWETGEEYSWVITVKPDNRAVGSVSCRVQGPAVDLCYVFRGSIGGVVTRRRPPKLFSSGQPSLKACIGSGLRAMSTTLGPSAFWRRSECLERAYIDAGLFGQILLQEFLEMISSTRGCARPNPRLQRTRTRSTLSRKPLGPGSAERRAR